MIDLFVGQTARIFVAIMSAVFAVFIALILLFLVMIVVDRAWAWWSGR